MTVSSRIDRHLGSPSLGDVTQPFRFGRRAGLFRALRSSPESTASEVALRNSRNDRPTAAPISGSLPGPKTTRITARMRMSSPGPMFGTFGTPYADASERTPYGVSIARRLAHSAERAWIASGVAPPSVSEPEIPRPTLTKSEPPTRALGVPVASPCASTAARSPP